MTIRPERKPLYDRLADYIRANFVKDNQVQWGEVSTHFNVMYVEDRRFITGLGGMVKLSDGTLRPYVGVPIAEDFTVMHLLIAHEFGHVFGGHYALLPDSEVEDEANYFAKALYGRCLEKTDLINLRQILGKRFPFLNWDIKIDPVKFMRPVLDEIVDARLLEEEKERLKK